MSLALEQHQGCTGASLGCSRARDILGSLRPRPEKTTCSFPYRFARKNTNSGLVPGNRDPNYGLVNLWFACGSPVTKTTEITKMTKTTKTTQTATSAGFTEIMETTKMTKTTGIQGANGFRNTREKTQPKVFLHKVFLIPGRPRPKPRDIPAIPCLKQQKKAPCIKLLSGISRLVGP